MSTLTIQPPVVSALKGAPFVQHLRLGPEDAPLATAHWHAPANLSEGVAQLLDLAVSPTHRRQGHAGRLIREVIVQASAYYRSRRVKLRRLWLAVEQKHQVIARAFLTSHGFHHIATVKDVLKDEDLMIYSKSFD
jgi:ribosomal protein S18 acetylase RimI-like enzyme